MKRIVWTAIYALVSLPALCSAVEILPQKHTYEGMSSISAAVLIDEDTFVACCPEDNVLRVYKTGSAVPIACLDVSGFLGLDGESADIRGATRIADRIYWIETHSRDEDGREKTSRSCFFATTVKTDSSTVRIEPVGKPCTTLFQKLPYRNNVSTLRLDRAIRLGEELTDEQQSRLAPTKEGLSIEALAADPRIGTLFIGFRNPRPVRVLTGRPHALVVPLNNAADVVEEGREPIFGEAMLWDFDGLGITGFEHSPAQDAYFIVAQRHDRNKPCVLYHWSGMKASSPEETCRLDCVSEASDTIALGSLTDVHQVELLLAGGHSRDLSLQKRQFRSIHIRPPLR